MLCPVCRADNDAPSACRRCKADLTLVWQMHQTRAELVGRAQSALVRRQLTHADYFIRQAEAIERDAETGRLRAVLSLLRGDFSAALASYAVVQGLEE